MKVITSYFFIKLFFCSFLSINYNFVFLIPQNVMNRKQSGYVLFYIIDLVLLFVSFVIMAWYKQSSVRTYISSHHLYFLILASIWLMTSLINGKIPGRDAKNYTSYFIKVIISNLIAFGATMIILFGSGEISLSRIMVFGTVLMGSIFELIMGSLIFSFRKAQLSDTLEESYIRHKSMPSEYELVKKIRTNTKKTQQEIKVSQDIIDSIENEIGKETAKEIIEMIGSKLTDRIAVMSIINLFNIKTLPRKFYCCIINLHKINDIHRLDQFIDAVNRKLDIGGLFLYCVETKDQRKTKILDKYPLVLNYLVYFFDFIFNRVFPKMRYTRKLHNLFSGGKKMVISRAEALGRVRRGGFDIINERFIGDLLFIEASKKSEPLPIKENIGSPIIALPRIGKNGMEINVFKMRTMHPYSEYIQDYVYKQSDIQTGGKFMNDFRVTSWGAVCRKIWLDELPMFINFFKGELKLVGVRPLSKHYFSLYDPSVQERRIKYKPGLIPPFYYDMPKDLESIQASEIKYLDSYDKNPFFTDCRYLFISVWNILFRHARSK